MNAETILSASDGTPAIVEAFDEAGAGHERLLTEQEWYEFTVMAEAFGAMLTEGQRLSPEQRTNVAVLRAAPPEFRTLLESW